MKEVVILFLFLIKSVILVACHTLQNKSLDGGYYWTSSERNELAFTIKEDNGIINHGEAENFTVNRKNSTFKLLGTNVTNSTINYQTKDGAIIKLSNQRWCYHSQYLRYKT